MKGSKSKRNIAEIVKTVLLFIFLAIYIMPFILVLINSLKRKAEIIKFPLALMDSQGFQFKNYATALDRMDFIQAFSNSIIVTALSILILLLFSSMAAYLFARKDWKICKASFSVLLASMILPFQVVMIPLISIYGAQLNIINSLGTLIFMNIGFGLSLCTFMTHGFIKTSIPIALEEAATIDGANGWQRFMNITIPSLKPVTFMILLTSTINAFKVFAMVQTLTNGGPGTATTYMIQYIYQTGFTRNRHGYASAASMILFVVLLIISFIQTRMNAKQEEA